MKKGQNVCTQFSKLFLHVFSICALSLMMLSAHAKPPSEGIDMFAEEASWKTHKGKLPSHTEFTTGSPTNERVNDIKKSYKIFYGDFFEVFVLKSFKARPLHPIERYDINGHFNSVRKIKLPPKYFEYVKTSEAFFTSPDGLVEFSVFAKDVASSPDNFMEATENEVVLSLDSKKYSYPEKHLNYVLKHWITIKAKDGSYYRSYSGQRACRDGKFDTCETVVFGIKYSSIKAYNKYRDAFIVLNRSLIRTAAF